MDQIRPSRGKARGRPQVATNPPPGVSGFPQIPTNQQGLSGLPQGVRGPRPIHTTPSLQPPITGPRPTSSQPIHSTQPLPTPITGVTMQRPPRQMQPRAAGPPQQRAPRPLGPRPVVSSDQSTAPRQDPMAGVRISSKCHTIYVYLYAMFFKGATSYRRTKKFGCR